MFFFPGYFIGRKVDAITVTPPKAADVMEVLCATSFPEACFTGWDRPICVWAILTTPGVPRVDVDGD